VRQQYLMGTTKAKIQRHLTAREQQASRDALFAVGEYKSTRVLDMSIYMFPIRVLVMRPLVEAPESLWFLLVISAGICSAFPLMVSCDICNMCKLKRFLKHEKNKRPRINMSPYLSNFYTMIILFMVCRCRTAG
jgi:hypothetical protein